jgi:branched-chain amino acid transport system substrate-binding protein
MAALVSAAGLAACGSSNNTAGGGASPTPAATPIVIGAVLPLTGSFGVIGQAVSAGMHTGIDQINASGGAGGHHLELVIEDDQSSAAKAATATTLLLDKDKADVVEISPISAEALASLPITTQRKVLTLTQSGNPALGDTTKYPYNFMYSIPYQVQAHAMVLEAQQLGGKKVGTLTTGDAGGKAAMDPIVADLQRSGVQVVDSETFDTAVQDATPVVAKLKQAGADLLMLQAPAGALGVAMRAVQQLGWSDVQVLATPGTATGDLSKLVPSQVNSQFKALVPKVQMRSTADKLDAPLDSYVTQLTKYQADVPSILASVFATDLMHVAGWGIAKAGGGQADALRTALESIGTAKVSGLYAYSNPAYDAANHTPAKADYSTFWSVITASAPLDGTYVGRIANLPGLRSGA